MSEDTPARVARRLMRQAGRVSLGTRLEGEVSPYVSLALVACDQDISPLLFLSDLAQHTRNLTADPHACLLFDDASHLADPLTGSRLSLLGEAEPVDDPRAMDRYIRRQPSAGLYRTFADFRLWRITPRRGQLVAGFGRIEWIDATALRPDHDLAARLALSEPEIIARINDEHPSLIETLGAQASGLADWRLNGVDPDGVDLRADHQFARLDFKQPPAGDAAGVLAELHRLAQD